MNPSPERAIKHELDLVFRPVGGIALAEEGAQASLEPHCDHRAVVSKLSVIGAGQTSSLGDAKISFLPS